MKKEVFMYVIIFAALILQATYYFPLLPETMATHFDFNGVPNSWMSKEFFFIFEFVLIVVIFASVWASLAFMRKFPKTTNIPNKDYWLSENKIGETTAFFQKKMHYFCIATSIFTLFIMQSVIMENLQGEPPAEVILNNALLRPAIFAYVVYVLIWSAGLYMKFHRIPQK